MSDDRAETRVARMTSAIQDRLDRPVRHPLGLVALAIAWSVLAWLRVSPNARETIWAEDGTIFLEDSQRFGPIGALLIPYAGYMHVLPRLVAGIAWLFPVDAWAQALTAVSCVVAGLIGLLVYLVTARLPVAPWARLLLGSVSVLAPALVAEVLGNAANLYPLALWAAIWLFLFRPQRWWSAGIAGLIALVLSSTAIQMLPLVALLAVRPSRRALPIAGGFAIGFALQLWGFANSVRPSHPSWPLPGALADGYLHQVVLGSWVQSAHFGATLILYFGWFVTLVALAPFLAATIVLWRSRTQFRLARTFAVVLPLISVAYWCALVALNNLAVDYSNLSPTGLVTSAFTLRYAVFPSMVLLALVIVAIGWIRARDETPTWWGKVRGWVIVVLLLISVVHFFGLESPLRSRGPEWSDSLAAARSECETMPDDASVALPIAPVSATWAMDLPCSVVVPSTQDGVDDD